MKVNIEEVKKQAEALGIDFSKVLEVAKMLEKAPEEERARAEFFARGAEVQRLPVSREGFAHFYWTVTLREFPYVFDKVVEAFVKAYFEKKAVMCVAPRGMGKTTFQTLWGAYLVGKNALGSTVVVRINDQAAKDTGESIARIIKANPGWKACFPNVIPDPNARWSTENGYFVIDTNITGLPDSPGYSVGYGRWSQMCYADHTIEPSLVCAGLESGLIIGKHPSNGMWFDDLHDVRNTRSVREMEQAKEILEANIIPTWHGAGGKPTVGVVCTFWDEKDAYHAMLATGMFELVNIPIFERDDNGVMFEPYGYKVKLTWPEKFPLEEVEQIWRENPAQFPRMYMGNLEMMKGMVLKREWLHTFPFEKIDPTWPVYFGIDFASTEDKFRTEDRDYFALAVGRAIPGGGLVLVDGFRDRIPINEAIDRVRAFAQKYPTLVLVGVEKWGKGEVFKDSLIYSTELNIVPCPYKGETTRSKGQRFQNQLAPMFTTGRMWVSDIDVEFIKNFRDEWISWDGDRSKTGYDDCLDAVYWCGYVAQSHIMPIPASPDLPVELEEEQKSPFASIGRL